MWSAWYAGDPNQLSAWYGGAGAPEVPGRGQGFFGTTFSYEASGFDNPIWKRWQFWSKRASDPPTRYRLHLPLASDIAQTSADLLFSEQPKLLIPDAHEQTAVGNSKDVQQRILDLAEEDGIYSTLLEAAEVSSALSGVFLRVTWDQAVADHPLLTAVHPDSAIPEFLWGRLQAVTFWRTLRVDKDDVFRLLERHEPGVIMHGLYKGTRDVLGNLIPLASLDEGGSLLAGMELEAQATTTELTMPTGLDELTAVYVPNQKPNRKDRTLPIGRSDFAGVEGLLDALDETYTSWMRELRLARARIMLPEELLETAGKGKGSTFDMDQEIFTTTNDLVGEDGGRIEFIQPAIRTTEHQVTATDLVSRIVTTAGYSLGSFGIKDESRSLMTATEVVAKQQRSMVTRAKKVGYWSRPLQEILERYMELDASMFKGPYKGQEVRVDFADSVEQDPKDVAQTIQLLDAAGAISLEFKVRMQHPDWPTEEVIAEVKRIQDDKAAAMALEMPPAPVGADGGPGAPGGPPGSPGGGPGPKPGPKPPAGPGPKPPGRGGAS